MRVSRLASHCYFNLQVGRRENIVASAAVRASGQTRGTFCLRFSGSMGTVCRAKTGHMGVVTWGFGDTT
jgi:hypothetical protein